MKHETSKSLYAYWDELRGNRSSALRTDIDPAHIKDHLPLLYTMKQTTAENYEFLLAGTGLFELFGRELTGQDMTRLFSGKEKESIQSLLFSVCEEQTASVVGFEGTTQDGREVNMEMLMLPISHRDDKVRIFGSLSIFDKPHWVGMVPVTSLAITSLRVIWPNNDAHFVDRAPNRRTNNVKASYLPLDKSRLQREIPIPAQTPMTRHGHLRVIEGGAK